MKPITVEQAQSKLCPFKFGQNVSSLRCIANQCMAWNVVHEKVERENHSNASNIMIEHAMKTGRVMKYSGPQGSQGKLYLEEVGTCGMAARNKD